MLQKLIARGRRRDEKLLGVKEGEVRAIKNQGVEIEFLRVAPRHAGALLGTGDARLCVKAPARSNSVC